MYATAHQDLGEPLEAEPFVFPYLDAPQYETAYYAMDMHAGVFATLENILDVPHTAFLHRGLFRSGARRQVEARIRRTGHGAEATFLGEARPGGLVGRVLAPVGGEVMHVDRFILPSIAQVEYALGQHSHLLISNALTPIDSETTRMHTVASLRLPLGSKLVRQLLTPLAKRIAKQDAWMLAAQSRNMRKFGGERFISTRADLLGPHILRLLRSAAAGTGDHLEPFEKTVHLWL